MMGARPDDNTTDRVAAVAPMTRREDTVMGLLCTWLVAGVLVDGYVHEHAARLETFFTPWHLFLYSGFTATAWWVGLAGVRRQTATRRWWRSFPPGYELAAAGAVLFNLSGIGDLLWHVQFGIERGQSALLSPTHLGLMGGGVLLLTAPLRSASRTRNHTTIPAEAALPLALATGIVLFLSHLLNPWWDVPFSHGRSVILAGVVSTAEGHDLAVAAGIGGFIVATLALFGPLVVVARRWKMPAWAVAVQLGLPPMFLRLILVPQDIGVAVLVVLAAVLAAVVIGRARRPEIGVIPAAGLYWGVYVVGVAVFNGVGWTAEELGGALVWSVLAVAGLVAVSDTGPARDPIAHP